MTRLYRWLSIAIGILVARYIILFVVGAESAGDEKLSWLLLFVIGYWSYCIYWGWKGARQTRTATDYFIANRSIGLWVFVLAATATSFSGWTFVGHPGTIYSVGLPYAFASFYAITIPLTGVIFLKRQWLLGKRYGYITPGEMFSDYYRTDWMRLLTVVVAMVFSVPYLGIQLRASGLLFSRLLEDTVLQGTFVGTIEGGAILLSVIVFLYVASGGLRSVAYVDCAQCILLAIGIVILGFVALDLVGGWGSFKEGLAGWRVKAQIWSPYPAGRNRHRSSSVPALCSGTPAVGRGRA